MASCPSNSSGPGLDQTLGSDNRHRPFPSAPILCDRGAPQSEWIDYNGHMNLGYYLIAIDRATMRFFENWVGVGPSMAARWGMGSFVLQSHMHFMRELRQDDVYEAYIQLLDIDAKRWRYVTTLTKAQTGEPAASAEQIAMCVDHASRKSAPLPEPQSARLRELMAAHRALTPPPQVGARLEIRTPSA